MARKVISSEDRFAQSAMGGFNAPVRGSAFKAAMPKVAARLCNAAGISHPSVSVTFIGQTAFCKHSGSGLYMRAAINLPALSDTRMMQRDEANRWLGYLIHETFHALLTDRQQWDSFVATHSPFRGRMLNAVEDARIERDGVSLGYARGFANVGVALVAHLMADGGASVDPNDARQLPWVFAIGLRDYGVPGEGALLSRLDPRIAAILQWARGELAALPMGHPHGTHLCGALADAICERLKPILAEPQVDRPEPQGGDEQQEADEQPQGDDESKDEGKSKSKSKSKRDDADEGDKSKDEGEGDDDAEGLGEGDADADDGEESDEGEGEGGESTDDADEEGEGDGEGEGEGDDATAEGEGGGEGDDDADGEGEGDESGDADEEGEGEGDGDADGEGEGEGEGDDADDATADDADGIKSGGGDGKGGKGAGDSEAPAPVDIDSIPTEELRDVEPQVQTDRDFNPSECGVIFGGDPKERDMMPRDADAQANSIASAAAAMRSVKGLIAARSELRRLLQRTDRVEEQRGLRNGRIVRSQLHRAGLTDAIFGRRTEEDGEDVAVSIVLDCSGSMGYDKMQQASLTALIIAEQLCMTAGVKVEVVGFHSESDGVSEAVSDAYYELRDANNGARPVLATGCGLYVFKRFNEHIGAFRRRYTTACAAAGGGTPDLGAMHAAVKRVAKLPAGRRIVFMLCDGDGAPGDVFRSHADKLANQYGVLIVGLGIGCGAHFAQRFPFATVIYDVNTLAKESLRVVINAIEKSGR